MFEAEVERLRLAGIWLSQDEHASGGFLICKSSTRDFQGVVAGTVINHDHLQAGIIRSQHSAHRALDHLLFVVGGNQHCDGGLVRRCLARAAVWLLAEAIENRESSDK